MSLATSDYDLRAILAHAQRIAVVGLSDNADRPSNRVSQGMSEAGYDIVPVNPNVKSVLGARSKRSLDAVNTHIGMVTVFRAPAHVADIVDQCVNNRIRSLWLQPGSESEAAIDRAISAGIRVVAGHCMFEQYKRLLA